MDRRKFVWTAGILGASAVAGFDPVARRWIGAVEAAGEGPFDDVPQLDGRLLFDLRSRDESSRDMGNIRRVLPLAVLRPGSVSDVEKMVKYCRERGIRVGPRGQHHSMHGQSLSPGLSIEMVTLGRVLSIEPTRAVVEAGITWRALLERTLEHGLRPRGLPGYVGLSVGGTLSVGGCPMTSHSGGLVDTVRALQVVTGAGDVVECSETENRELFEAALGGLGEMGVITRATVDLVPAKARARTYNLHYTEAEKFFEDMRTLFDRGELDDCYNVCMPPGSSTHLFEIQATIFYDEDSPPDVLHVLRDLHHPAFLALPIDRTYYDYVTSVDAQFFALQRTVQWNDLVKPWYDVWLPDDAVEEHVGEILSTISQEDVGTGGLILLFMQRRSRMRRPFFRVPDARGADRVWLFDLATTSTLPGPDPEFAERMTRRNRRWFDAARELGGTRYAIGVLDFNRPDWERHFGDAWGEFVRRKRKYDPDNVMAPGLGMF